MKTCSPDSDVEGLLLQQTCCYPIVLVENECGCTRVDACAWLAAQARVQKQVRRARCGLEGSSNSLDLIIWRSRESEVRTSW
jgi:hypothetical protein